MIDESQLKTFFNDFLLERGVRVEGGRLKDFNFVASGLLDSFEILSMIINIESEFGIKVTPEELIDKQNSTVGGLMSTILAKR